MSSVAGACSIQLSLTAISTEVLHHAGGSREVKTLARRACRQLATAMQAEDSFFTGQSVAEAKQVLQWHQHSSLVVQSVGIHAFCRHPVLHCVIVKKVRKLPPS